MRVFVGCSSKDAVAKQFKELTSDVCTMLANGEHKLIFGGIDKGMMGTAYMTFKYEGKKVKGIVDLKNSEILKSLEVDAYQVTPTTFERDKEIYLSSEMFIFLPGGLGTLAELFTFLEEKKTNEDEKEIVLFNYNNYYDSLLNCLRKMYVDNFISERDLKNINVVTDVKSLEMFMKRIELNRRSQ